METVDHILYPGTYLVIDNVITFFFLSGNQYREPSLRAPSFDQLEEIATKLGLRFTDKDELKEYQAFIETFCEGFNAIDRLPEPTLPVKYPRFPGHRPKPEENPLNGWYVSARVVKLNRGK
ncbi:hypothetical protein HOLleu_39705 [Holothuria leucospilota]|uniref:Uncharacterized protein n=1 Tax=Holothuria leucospilota TaxID=206669 RepID=A0A9Q0YCC8_HOLLE|nr:hypothetical protein HOLleu_39705 [Holothuria leucospilota]